MSSWAAVLGHVHGTVALAPGTETRQSGAVVLAVLGGGLFVLGLGIALFATMLVRRATIAGTLMAVGVLLLLILVVEVRGDAPTLPPARPGPYPVPDVGGTPPPVIR